MGYYDVFDATYETSRDARKGEVFLKMSHLIDGKLVNKPLGVAIDAEIMRNLMARQCKKVVINHTDIKGKNTIYWTTPFDILTKGVKINYDDKEKGKQNRFGEQYLFSLTEDCVLLDLRQKKLEVKKCVNIVG